MSSSSVLVIAIARRRVNDRDIVAMARSLQSNGASSAESTEQLVLVAHPRRVTVLANDAALL
jgi:hypothetical protein